jgi:HEPN domain-containing protein
MKRSTLEWIKKAEGDWAAALRLYRARKQAHYDIACFLAQQCAEKYLKAQLNEASVSFAKTHDLPKLLTHAEVVEPALAALQPQVDFLDEFSVQYRYPGRDATKAQVQQAIKDCRTLRKVMRTLFGLPIS